MRTDESIPADAVASSAEVIKTLWWSELRHSRSAQRGNLLNLEKKIAIPSAPIRSHTALGSSSTPTRGSAFIDSIAAAVEIRTFKARQAEGVAHRDDPLTTGARSAEDGPMPRSTIKEYT
jgi:hypothetical protein